MQVREIAAEGPRPGESRRRQDSPKHEQVSNDHFAGDAQVPGPEIGVGARLEVSKQDGVVRGRGMKVK